MKKYVAYIDESGDEGIKRGTEWLILTAVIVEKDDDLRTSTAIVDIKNALQIPHNKPFHWKLIRNKHASKKRLVIDRIARENFHYINIIVNTTDLEDVNATSKLLYNYFCRFLIERITWFVDDNRGTVEIVFSNRSNTSWVKLEEYIAGLCASGQCQIRNNVITQTEVFETTQRKMLQFADACASSLGEALNEDVYGYIDERYILKLSDKLYRRKGKLFSYGLKIFPDKHLHKYINRYDWLKTIK